MTRPDEGTQCYDWFFCTRPLPRKSSKKFPYNNRKTTQSWQSRKRQNRILGKNRQPRLRHLRMALSGLATGHRRLLCDLVRPLPPRSHPILEELSEEYAGEVDIYKVDIDREQELAAAFGVRSVPTLLFIPARGMPQMATGALPKETLQRSHRRAAAQLPAAES